MTESSQQQLPSLQVDVRARRGGKTIAMLEQVEKLPEPSQAVVVCITAAEAARVGCLYNERNPGKPLPRFVTPEGSRNLRGIGRAYTFLDNADILLADLVGRHLDYMTTTGRLTGD